MAKKKRRVKVVGTELPPLEQLEPTIPATIMGLDLAMERSLTRSMITFYVDNAFLYTSAVLELQTQQLPSLILEGVEEKDSEAWRTLNEYTIIDMPSHREVLLRFYWRGHYFLMRSREREMDHPPIAPPRSTQEYEELQFIDRNQDYTVRHTFRLEGADLDLNNGADLKSNPANGGY